MPVATPSRIGVVRWAMGRSPMPQARRATNGMANRVSSTVYGVAILAAAAVSSSRSADGIWVMARERMAAPSHADALLDDTHQWMESRPPLASASAVAVTRNMAPEVPTGQSLTDTTAKPSTWGNRIKRLRSSKSHHRRPRLNGVPGRDIREERTKRRSPRERGSPDPISRRSSAGLSPSIWRT
jgi:hypothetical protein